MTSTIPIKDNKARHWFIGIYCLLMLISFVAGNVFIDSYNVFVIRFLYPDADIVLIFLISLVLLLFFYIYFRSILKSFFLSPAIKTILLIFTWFGLMGVFLQNMLVPLNHFISYVELVLIFLMLGALLLGLVSEDYEGKLKLNYLQFLIGMILVNIMFVFIKRIVYENLGTSGVKLVVEVNLLGSTFNVTSFILLIFVVIFGLMIWSTVKNFQIITSDINRQKTLDLGNKNILGIILNQGAILIGLFGLVFISFYFMKNQDILKDFLHYSFSANVNYYSTMKWTYLSNLFFFVPFISLFFILDLSHEKDFRRSLQTQEIYTAS